MPRAKILVATHRGPPEDAGRFFSSNVQPFLEENVFRGRKRGLIVCEAMLYRMHFDFSSAAQARLLMGRPTDERLSMLQAGLDATARMLNSQFQATIGKGKRPLPPLDLGFERYVMGVNSFNQGAISLVVDPQNAQASYMHSEAEALLEVLRQIQSGAERIACMGRVIRLQAGSLALRNELLNRMIDDALDRDPALAIVLPRGAGSAGLHRSLNAFRCDISVVSDGSFVSYLEQAVNMVMDGEMDEEGIEEYSRLQLRYMDYLERYRGKEDWSRLSLEAAMYAVSETGRPEGPK